MFTSNDDFANTARTGLAKRRGTRGSGHGPPGASHHHALNAAMKAGDFAGAKKHALNLGGALHAHLTKGTPFPGKTPMKEPLPTDSQPLPGTSGGTSSLGGLAAMLRGR